MRLHLLAAAIRHCVTAACHETGWRDRIPRLLQPDQRLRRPRAGDQLLHLPRLTCVTFCDQFCALSAPNRRYLRGHMIDIWYAAPT